ncbi:MAG: hypothetical protein MK060_19425 [Blastomonas sp.]|uniref:hypothetical protein n=1 Tax=Blastomonas sp. TaxID=1909299 RepID=UPI003BBFC845|nr:hypothetical protein [Blastomonas sp.]
MAITELQAESAPVTSDAPIIAALANYRAARATYDLLPVSEVDGEQETPAELSEWARMDAAEQEIMDRPASTPQGVEAKLWLWLLHNQSPIEDDIAATAGNLDHFLATAAERDWSERLIISAIASLRAMQATAGRA